LNQKTADFSEISDLLKIRFDLFPRAVSCRTFAMQNSKDDGNKQRNKGKSDQRVGVSHPAFGANHPGPDRSSRAIARAAR
jgi:hypothetical protein